MGIRVAKSARKIKKEEVDEEGFFLGGGRNLIWGVGVEDNPFVHTPSEFRTGKGVDTRGEVLEGTVDLLLQVQGFRGQRWLALGPGMRAQG